jgi:3-phenylpropionate/cinnamic acid dioxygenase small subunit
MSSERDIENLIGRYAELVDNGDFAGAGELFAFGTFHGSSSAFTGTAAVAGMLHDQIRLYPNGTPLTRHVTTNLIVEVDEEAGTATSRSSVTIFQATSDLPLQAIAVGRYADEFRRVDGAWWFSSRRVTFQLAGDLSHHLLRGSGR